MSTFLRYSNLPEGKVTSLICGGLNNELIGFLKSRGIEILYSSENTLVDEAVSKHADLSVLYLGMGRIIVDKWQRELISQLRKSGLSVTETVNRVEGLYPNDCILNHAVVGSRIIGKSKNFDDSVKKASSDFDVISVNQGYCKCSVLPVDSNSIITDDESIARNSREKGLNCLLINKGDVFLEGHEYGFIGGASGKISKEEVMFFGDITKHRDYGKIEQFIFERGIKIVSFDFPLTDFGGIIPIKENIF